MEGEMDSRSGICRKSRRVDEARNKDGRSSANHNEKDEK